MIMQNKVIFLSGQLSFYYNARTVFIILFIALTIILILYGKKIGITTILEKKTGFRKKREIDLMKAGKSIKRRASSDKEGKYILHTPMPIQSNEREKNVRLEKTEKLEEINKFKQPQLDSTVLLENNNMDMQKKFCIIKNVIIVHGEPVSGDK